MSKHVNVNPGQYNVAGRERPGKDVAAQIVKQQYRTEKAREAKSATGTPPKTAGASKGNRRARTPHQP